MSSADTSTLTIPRVTVLTGHTDPDSAYVVDDSPYGRAQRCKIRYWVDTGQRGASKGKKRFAYQTTNPKRTGEVWHNPKYSTYSEIVTLYLDDKNHVQWHAVHFWIGGAEDARARAMGVYDGLTGEDRKLYDALVKFSRRINATQWGEWEERVALLADHIAETGADPELDNGRWKRGERLYYLSDPAAYVTAARNLLAERED